jgi:menaquinone-dependent protoporphyrinogen oxidase
MPKVLILYASKKGSTAEVAAYLADVLRKHKIEVDVTNAAEFSKDVLDYDAVLIGTGIYHGMWLNSLWNTVRRLTEQLEKIPVWGFALCVRILEEDGEAHILKHYLPRKVLNSINLKNFKFFAGRIEDLTATEVTSFAERYDGTYLQRRGDFRDWEAIHRYADEIAKMIVAITA